MPNTINWYWIFIGLLEQYESCSFFIIQVQSPKGSERHICNRTVKTLPINVGFKMNYAKIFGWDANAQYELTG